MLPQESLALLRSVGFAVPENVHLEIGTRKAWLLSGIIGGFDDLPAAVALGNTIYVPNADYYHRLSPEARAALLAHECEHVRQWRRLGVVRFAVHYMREYIRVRRQGIGTHDPLRGIDLEREALAVERRVLAALQKRAR